MIASSAMWYSHSGIRYTITEIALRLCTGERKESYANMLLTQTTLSILEEENTRTPLLKEMKCGRGSKLVPKKYMLINLFIYLTIQNLPINLFILLYKICLEQSVIKQNVVLVRMIPGPSEPPLTINSYLAPLVRDLQEAWTNGIVVPTRSYSVSVRLALTCIAYDMPASRKVCGFLGHNAVLGCSNCY